MRTVAGIFNTRADAERATEHLRSIGIDDKRISLLTPDTTDEQIEAAVPTSDTEQPGMGAAMGGTVGGAMGIAGGATMGAAAASLFVPGVGPVIAAGIIGAALLGAGGAAAGAVAGDAVEDSLTAGLPHDELYVYEDALRKGHSVVIAVAADDAQGEAAQNVLAQAGSESIDAARESWWVGTRDAEREEYTGQGRDFDADEELYRRGFEAALHPQARGKRYQERDEFLRKHYGEDCAGEAFKCGYDRGQSYYQQRMQEKKQ